MSVIASIVTALMLATQPGQAADPAPMTERTERIPLESRRGPSLLRPGFAIGEFTGSVASRSSSTRLPWQSSDMARSEFEISSPGLGAVSGGGRVMGYVFIKDGVEIGGVDLNGLRPTFYLPPQGSPDREAVAVLAVSLFAFADPANR